MTSSKRRPTPTLTYPLGLIDSPDVDYVVFTAVEYQPPGITPVGGNNSFRFNNASDLARNAITNNPLTNNVGYLFLPIPDNVADVNQTNWRTSSINSLQMDGVDLGRGILDVTSSGGDVGDIISGVGQELSDKAKKYTQGITDPTVRRNIESALLGKAVNSIGGNIDAQDLVSRDSGQILNPNMELLFKSIQLQTFSYNFTFTARSAEEGNMVKSIIRTFKKRMSPKSTAGSSLVASGLFIAAPDVFEIKFMKGGEMHPFLPRHKVCALTNMQTNYTGGGSYATYYDGTPVNVSMTLTFTELSPVYAEDFDESIEGVGF
jgi:hypothetical protein